MSASDRPGPGEQPVPLLTPRHVCPLSSGHEPGTGLSGERSKRKGIVLPLLLPSEARDSLPTRLC